MHSLFSAFYGQMLDNKQAAVQNIAHNRFLGAVELLKTCALDLKLEQIKPVISVNGQHSESAALWWLIVLSLHRLVTEGK